MIRRFMRLRRERAQGLPKSFHDTGSVFVHVPKTGGISVCNAIYDGIEYGHRPYSELLSIDPQASNYFSFAFVRDPAERLLSAFIYVQNGGINKFDRAFSKHVTGMTFDQFVDCLPNNRTLSKWMHFRPQSHYIDRPVDFIGRFENLDADFRSVVKTLGLDAELPHANAVRASKPAITPETRRKIERHFAKDYECFGY